MAGSVAEPRVDDFGITEEDLSRAPCLFVAGHRPTVIVIAYLVAAGCLFGLLLNVGGSPAGAMFFTVIALAAGSILLLPVLMVAVCASERVEERWLCGRFPKLSACLAYRAAVADHRRRERKALAADRTSRMWWSFATPDAFRKAARSELKAAREFAAVTADREATGFDFELKSADGPVLIRCEPGAKPVLAAVGRELMAAMADRGAARSLIVTAGGTDPALANYIVGRPIKVVAPWELDNTLRN